MNRSQRELALRIARKLLPEQEFDRLMDIPIRDEGYGFDPFGLERESAAVAYVFARYLYKNWFRVESEGHEHIPLKGRGLIACNHSGVLPLDGAMVAVDMMHKLKTPRIVRSMVDNFMGFLPFLNVFFYRVGQVVGARRNFEDLLRQDELVSVFPEGTRGIGKPYSRKYKLVRFNVGFIELALRFQASIVPCAVVGAEEQAPMLFNIKPLARLLGFPYFPVTPFFPLLGPVGMIPLPVKFHIRYGPAIEFYKEHPPEAADDPEIIRGLADKVQLGIQEMINGMLEKRKSVFAFGDGRSEQAGGSRRRRRLS